MGSGMGNVLDYCHHVESPDDGDLILRVNVRCSTAAFDDTYPGLEVARILRDIAAKIDSNMASGCYQTIFDINGNDVGRYRLKREE
jgi:hypothetical protein